MKVLSLFDGMSCGRIALDRLGVEVEEYYASEVDKYAKAITFLNWPDTVQMGDVTKWREWELDWGGINLLLGGSPCQGFSFAGKQLNFDDPRSQLFFVYVDILNHIKRLNPNVLFLLENVPMKKEHEAVITQHLGVAPIKINSALVSAQNRKRLYWTNIPGVTQPVDRGILLRDVVHEYSLVDRSKATCLTSAYQQTSPRDYLEKSRGQYVFNTISLSETETEYTLRSSGNWSPGKKNRLESYLNYPENKHHTLTASFAKGVPYNCFFSELGSYIVPFDKTLEILEKEVERGKIGFFRKDSQGSRVYVIHGRILPLPALKNNNAKAGAYLFGSVDREVHQVSSSKQSHGQQPYMQNRVYNINGISPALTQECARPNVGVDIKELGVMAARDLSRGSKIGGGQLFNEGSKSFTLTTHCRKQGLLFGCIAPDRLNKKQNGQRFNEGHKFYTLTAQDRHGVLVEGYLRKLTPVECERLQTLPDNYTQGVSNSQRYKMIGNGWTVDVICHILKGIELLY